MNIKEKFKTIRNNYIINQVESVVLPILNIAKLLEKS